MTITPFLLARIADREAALDVPEWRCTNSARGDDWGTRGDECPECGAYMFEGAASATEDAWREHMADRHGRVLRECKAMRACIEAAWTDWVKIEGEWGMCRERDELEVLGDVPAAITALATIYADHPDYDPAWEAQE